MSIGAAGFATSTITAVGATAGVIGGAVSATIPKIKNGVSKIPMPSSTMVKNVFPRYKL